MLDKDAMNNYQLLVNNERKRTVDFLELYKDKKLTDEKVEEYLSLPEDRIDVCQKEALEKLKKFLQRESFIVDIFKNQIKEKENQIKQFQKEVRIIKSKLQEIEEVDEM